MATKSAGFRITETEEKLILAEMVLTGETEVGNHIKRVYFETITGDKVSLSNGALEDIFLHVKFIREMVKDQDNDLLLNIMAGIYLMLRKSVSKKIQDESDELIDHEQLELFLKKEG